MFAAFLTAIFFSFSAISGHRCARVFGGLEANFNRLVIASILLLIYAISLGQTVSGKAATVFVLSGVVGVGLGDLFFFQALPRIGSRFTVLLIQCLTVPFAALVEWLWLGTTLTAMQLLWGGVILSGLCIALAQTERTSASKKALLPGISFAVLAAIGNSFGAVLSRKAYQIADASGEQIDGPSAACRRVLGGLLVATLALLIARWPVLSRRFAAKQFAFADTYKARWRQCWPWVLATSLAGQTFGVSCFQWALKSHPTGVVLPIVALTPLVTIPFARVFEGDAITIRSVIGGTVAVAGVIALLLCR